MTHDDAEALVQFIADHDTRFQAAAMTDEPEAGVQLTRPEDGRRLDPIYHIAEYGARHLTPEETGPTITEAWERWLATRGEAASGL